MVFHNNAAGGNSWDIGKSIVIDSSGRILVTGKSDNSRKNPDMVIWRYNPDGTLDEGFGQGGVVVYDGAVKGNEQDTGLYLALDAKERILVLGSSYTLKP